MNALADNIIARFDTIDLADVSAGADWYAEAYAFCKDLAAECGYTAAQVAGVVAAVSPMNAWAANKALAERIVRAGGGITSGYLSMGLRKADAILAGASALRTLNAQKTQNFFLSITSQGRRGICIDRHAHDIAMGRPFTDKERGGVSGGRYIAIAAAYKLAAEELNARGCDITPAELQSVTWVSWVAEFGGTRR